MLVREVMRKNVKTIRPDDDIKTAADEMNKSRIGSLVVITSGGSISGILTERDILSKVVSQDKIPSQTLVGEVMSTRLIKIHPDTTLENAAEIMAKNKIKKLPVVEEGILVGIITASDLISYHCNVVFEDSLIEQVASMLAQSKPDNMGG